MLLLDMNQTASSLYNQGGVSSARLKSHAKSMAAALKKLGIDDFRAAGAVEAFDKRAGNRTDADGRVML